MKLQTLGALSGMKRALHPALKAHGAAVKAAHAHLSATVPGFRTQAPTAQFKATQAHVRKTR